MRAAHCSPGARRSSSPRCPVSWRQECSRRSSRSHTRNLGLPVLFGAVAVLLIFQHADRRAAALRGPRRPAGSPLDPPGHAAVRRAGDADGRARAARPHDPRHAAAVARYAKALAIEMGCERGRAGASSTPPACCTTSASSPGLTASCTPTQLTDEDLGVIHRHPQDGATLVGKLDGYGPVADAILYHHERVDGGGYPAGLIGSEIPLASRIVAVCSTYDRMTARESYRAPMARRRRWPSCARSPDTSSDAELVESFIALLQREGPDFAQPGDSGLRDGAGVRPARPQNGPAVTRLNRVG